MRSSGGVVWAPSPIESLHHHGTRIGPPEPNQEMYKTFMFKKTMVIVACLLAAVVVVAHWASAVRFIMFLLHRSRSWRSASSSSTATTSAPTPRGSEELFKAEQRDSDSRPLRPIQMVKYSASRGKGRMGSECMICLAEFRSGEKVGLLPECGHGFHRPCIEMWLFSHSNCPICRHSLMQQHQDLDPAPSPP